MLPQDAIYVLGDTWKLTFQLFLDKKNKVYWDLTDNKIRFQLNTNPKIYKATANVSGGSSDQINIINATQGIFEIIILSSETSIVTVGDYTMAVKVTTTSEEDYTVLPDTVGILRAVEESIDWNSKPSGT